MNQKNEMEKNVLSIILILLVIFLFSCPIQENFSRKCITGYSDCASKCLKEDDPGKKEDCYIKCNKERNECDLGDFSKPLFEGSMGNRILSEQQASAAYQQKVEADDELTDKEVCWGEKCIKKTKKTNKKGGEASKNNVASVNSNKVPATQGQLNSDMREVESGKNSINIDLNNKLIKCEMKLNLIKDILLKN